MKMETDDAVEVDISLRLTDRAQWNLNSPECLGKFQALVYDVLPPIIAIIDYTIGFGKRLANGQFFIGAQMAVSL